eukprot:2869320-Pyramimonas_sp.AAC.1
MELAADGSCTKQAPRTLRRAALAMPWPKPESDEVLAILRGPVAGHPPPPDPCVRGASCACTSAQ